VFNHIPVVLLVGLQQAVRVGGGGQGQGGKVGQVLKVR